MILKQVAGIQKLSCARNRGLWLRRYPWDARRLRLKAPLQLQDGLLEEPPRETCDGVEHGHLTCYRDYICKKPVLQPVAPAEQCPSFVVREKDGMKNVKPIADFSRIPQECVVQEFHQQRTSSRRECQP